MKERASLPNQNKRWIFQLLSHNIHALTVHQPTIGKYSLYESTNENGLRLVDFVAGRQMAIKNTYFMHKRNHLQTWHSPGRPERTRIGRASNTKAQQLRRFAVDRLKNRDVASRYYDELKSELQGVQAQPLGLDEKC
jgi:hypothetical protein